MLQSHLFSGDGIRKRLIRTLGPRKPVILRTRCHPLALAADFDLARRVLELTDLREALTVRTNTKAEPRTTTNVRKVMVSRPGIETTVKYAVTSVVATVLVNQLPLSAHVLSSHDDAADTISLKGASDFSTNLAGSASS